MNFGVLTYNGVPHRKTYDLLQRCEPRCVFAIPWVERGQHTPLIRHRPVAGNIPSTDTLCKEREIPYKPWEEMVDFGCPILIAGAGIIPKEITEKCVLINSHPGYLPNVRGLDAVKWAIWENQPIGVTCYYLDDSGEADTGYLISRQQIPDWDLWDYTLWDLFDWVYEIEIELLAASIHQNATTLAEYLGKTYYDKRYGVVSSSPAHRRMPRKMEALLPDIYKKRQIENRLA